MLTEICLLNWLLVLKYTYLERVLVFFQCHALFRPGGHWTKKNNKKAVTM